LLGKEFIFGKEKRIMYNQYKYKYKYKYGPLDVGMIRTEEPRGRVGETFIGTMTSAANILPGQKHRSGPDTSLPFGSTTARIKFVTKPGITFNIKAERPWYAGADLNLYQNLTNGAVEDRKCETSGPGTPCNIPPNIRNWYIADPRGATSNFEVHIYKVE
jgi:hypothetical protein